MLSGRGTALARGLAGLLLAAGAAAPARAETIQAQVRMGERLRLLEVRTEGEAVMLPLLACGTLLGARARWHASTNRWEMRDDKTSAEGFLDEPLLLVNRQPILVKRPPRLLDGLPYLSLEVVQLLGRHGWNVEVTWNGEAQEIEVQPARLRQAAEAEAIRTVTVPQVAPGSRVVVLDAGHARREGARGYRGLTEGDLGLKLAAAVSASLAESGFTPVTLQGEGERMDPREAAGLANSLAAEFFVSFHASEYGGPGPAVWYWRLDNILDETGVSFDPFEPRGGWAHAARASEAESRAAADALVAGLRQGGIAASGPHPGPLAALEGLNCPGVVVSLDGFATLEGASLAIEASSITHLAGVIADTLRDQLGGRR